MPGVTRRGTAGLVIATALLAGGCANATTTGAAAPEPAEVRSTTIRSHEGRFLGAVTHRHRYDDPGITMTPPPAAARADVSWTDAFDACFAGALQCVTTDDAVVSLAMVTGPGDAVVHGRQMFEDALTYVVTWDPADCSRPDLAGSRCRLVDLLTADDGNVPAGTNVYTFEIPESSPPPSD